MGGRGTVGRKDVNWIGAGFAVGDMDIPRITSHSGALALTGSTYFCQPTRMSWHMLCIRGWCRVGVELSWLHCDEREQAYIIPDRVIVAAAFAVVRVPDVLAVYLGPSSAEQVIKWSRGG